MLLSPVIRAWLAVLMGGIFYCYQFILRVSPNVMTDELMLAFGVDAGMLAIVISLYYYGYAGMQIPLGILMDRTSTRKIIGFAAIVCGIATYFFATSSSVILAGSARFVIGMGSACGYLGTLKLGSQWFTRNKMPYIVGITMLLGTAGGSLGTMPLEYLLNFLGLHNTLYILAFFGIGLGILILLFMGKAPHAMAVPEEQHILQDLFMIIKMPQAWLLSIFALLMYVPLTVIGDLWGISFIERKYDIPESLSGIAIICMFVGVGLGGPIFAWFSDYVKSRKKPMFLGAVATFFIYIIILFMPSLAFPWICVLFFLAGIFFNGQCIGFSCICEIMPQHASGVAIGFLNMLVMASGFIFLPIIGAILVRVWDGKIANGIPYYSAANFQLALTVIPICLGIALVITTFINDTYHVVQKTDA